MAYRPRHPQSQGKIERSHDAFKTALTKMMDDYNTKDWPKLVPFVQGLMNNRTTKGFARTPYEMVYGTLPKMGYKNNAIPKPGSKVVPAPVPFYSG